MEIVRVKVKDGVTGMHGVSGLFLQAGDEHDIERGHFGYQIMDPIGWTPTDEELGIKPTEPEKTEAGAQEIATVKEAAHETTDKEE